MKLQSAWWLGRAAIATSLILSACAKKENLPQWLLKPVVPPGTDVEPVFHHNNLGVAHLERHHYQDAANEFRKVVEAIPAWAEGHVNLGIAALSQHDNPAAIHEYEKALEISPRHPYAHYGLGLVYKQDGKSQESLREFEEVLKVDPSDPDTLYNLGLL